VAGYMNTDIHLFHELKEHAKKMSEVFMFLEMKAYGKCKFYHYDSMACESTCFCPEIDRTGKTKRIIPEDFDPEKECWLCDHYEIEGEEDE